MSSSFVIYYKYKVFDKSNRYIIYKYKQYVILAMDSAIVFQKELRKIIAFLFVLYKRKC